MPFLDTYVIYEKNIPGSQGDVKIVSGSFSYQDGNFIKRDNGMVDGTTALIPYSGENIDEFMLNQNNDAFQRLLDDEQKINQYLEENPDSPKHKNQKKYVSDIKSYFRYWFDQKGHPHPEKGFYHSGDFRTLRQDGIEYYPTANQAKIIKILYQAYLYGTPELSQDYLITLLESDRETTYRNIREYFKADGISKTIYKKFIKTGQRKGTIRISLN